MNGPHLVLNGSLGLKSETNGGTNLPSYVRLSTRATTVSFVLSTAVSLVGLIVLLAWATAAPGWEYVVALVPYRLPSMKAITALCLVLAALQILCHQWRCWRTMCALACAVLALILGSLSFQPDPPQTWQAPAFRLLGRPSILSGILFVVIAHYGIFETTHRRCFLWMRLTTGTVLIVGGASALIGLFLGIPILFGFVPSLGSSGMAVHTALCFVALGTAVLRLKTHGSF